MAALLIGAVLDSAFFVLHRKLKANTLDFARHKFGHVISHYNPWLCFAPLVDQLDERLIYYTPPTRGSLVGDEESLAAMRQFMGAEGRQSIEELPGAYTNWLPRSENTSNCFDAAQEIIALARSPLPSLYREMVEFVVPLGGGRNRGFSTHLARGAIFRALPVDGDSSDVAIDLIHEVGHQVLMVWQSVDPILTSDLNAPVFSQIRRTNRPAIQSFHAAVALAYMRSLETALPDHRDVQAAAARRGASYSKSLSHSLYLALEAVKANCTFTEVGQTMIEEMEAVI